MNIVYYKGNGYCDYMKYYNPNDINIFIGNRGTGKTFSFMHSKYRYDINEFEYHYTKQGGFFTWWGEFGDDYKSAAKKCSTNERRNIFLYFDGGFPINKTGGISA